MRKGYSTQLRLDSLPIEQVPLNLDCRSRIVPILRALQQVYSKAEVTARIMQLIEADVNRDSRKDCGRKGMDYWHIMVLASLRLGCNFTYDHLHDLAEKYNFEWDTPYQDWPEEAKEVFFLGDGDISGLVEEWERLFHETNSEEVRAKVRKFLREEICPECAGKRLQP